MNGTLIPTAADMTKMKKGIKDQIIFIKQKIALYFGL